MLLLTAAVHPAITTADAARMSPALLQHAFTDTPAAHLRAERDFRRSRAIELAAARDSAARFVALAFA